MSNQTIKLKLTHYKQRFYLNSLMRGGLLTCIVFLSTLLIVSSLESFLWLGQTGRLFLFILLVSGLGISLIWGVIIPILALLQVQKGLSDEEAASAIGRFFPDVKDKLVNYIQLEKLQPHEQSLLAAALLQKSEELKWVTFAEAIHFRPNLRYVLIVVGIASMMTLVSFVSPGFFTESSSRIVQFNKEFVKPAPFSFILPTELSGYKNEDFELQVLLEGELIPDRAYILENGRRISLNRQGNGSFTFRYPNLQDDKTFKIEAAGYQSVEYKLLVFERPELRDFEVDMEFPPHTGLKPETVKNTGGLLVAEGARLTWNLNASAAEKVTFITGGKSDLFTVVDSEAFTYQRQVMDDLSYEISLTNERASNKSIIQYDITVVKDESPQLDVHFLPDTITYRSIYFTGQISDDYGFRNLDVFFQKNQDPTEYRLSIPITRSNRQNFYYQWALDSIALEEGDFLQIHVSVRDNDAINGFKRSDSEKFFFKLPSKLEMEEIVDKKGESAQKQLDESAQKAKELNEKLAELDERLKNNRKMDWQEQKMLEELLKEKKELNESIEALKRKHEELTESQKEFGQQSEKLQEKSKQLQELINEVLDEETRAMYEELQKMLQEKASSEEISQMLSKMQKGEKNLERELDRALELFKRLKMETALEQTSEKVADLGLEQQKLADETRQNEKHAEDSSSDELQQKQQEINEQFDELQEKLDEIQEMNQHLKRPEPMEDFNEDQQEIDEKQEEIMQNLNEKDLRKASEKQQNAGQKMKQMAQKMQKMQGGMEMAMMTENMDHLRHILDNLVKLSFDQERIFTDFNNVNQTDPRFIELSQDQLRLRDNSQVIQDSLLSLAERVVQISNFVTREISDINSNLDEAMVQLRERNKGKATSHQQFAMTSMNNLALLLDDVLAQMQMAMAEAMGNPQKGDKPGQSMPSMSELQKQLGEQIQELKKSGKSGRELSEELARLAAEQAELRQQMEEMQKSLEGQELGEEDGSGGGSKLKEAIEKMEQNEVDLVNKQLTNNLIKRQQEILTRMLEAEQSMREQKQSPDREGETAKTLERKIPPAFEEYLKARQSEIELLKTIPLDLNPFYKKEVNDYFRRLSGQE